MELSLEFRLDSLSPSRIINRPESDRTRGRKYHTARRRVDGVAALKFVRTLLIAARNNCDAANFSFIKLNKTRPAPPSADRIRAGSSAPAPLKFYRRPLLNTELFISTVS